MKKARLVLSILALSLAAGACSTSLTAPGDCEDEGTCQIVPGPNT